jgi:hypothetical protein
MTRVTSGRAAMLRLEQREGTVGAAVVREDHLVRPAEAVEDRVEPGKAGEVELLVVDRDDDGDLGAALMPCVPAEDGASARTTRATSDAGHRRERAAG